MSEQFIRRTTEPATNDPNWIHTSKGGRNSCIKISGNSVLPNCVGYCWGRWLELLNETPRLSRGNAEDWWAYNDGYERGSTPKLGATLVFAKGKVGTGSDGAGHVCTVEAIYDNGDIIVSNSAYGGRRWFEKTLTKSSGYSYGSAYRTLGFIYPPIDFVGDTIKTNNNDEVIEVNARKLKKGMKGDDVRMVMLTLKDKGMYDGNITASDKTFGDKMFAAVVKYQEATGCKSHDGVIGPETWGKLLAE